MPVPGCIQTHGIQYPCGFQADFPHKNTHTNSPRARSDFDLWMLLPEGIPEGLRDTSASSISAPREHRGSGNGAQRPKRMFSVGIETCAAGGEAVRIIARIGVTAVRYPQP